MEYNKRIKEINTKIERLVKKYNGVDAEKDKDLIEIGIRNEDLKDLKDKFEKELDNNPAINGNNIELTPDEKEVLKLDPKERVFNDIDVKKQRIHTEITMEQIRWQTKFEDNLIENLNKKKMIYRMIINPKKH